MKKITITIMALSMLIGNLSAKEGVILLHGLCRSSTSMQKMEKALQESGYIVENVSYPSRTANIKSLAELAVGGTLNSDKLKHCSKIHFVTHSLGGVLVRSYFHHHKDSRLGRTVMLAPPNQGSELVDRIGSWKIFKWINGPAGQEIGTSVDSVPNKLGEIDFECGVIAGDRSINWINSLMIPGKDDGKVSVKRSQVSGVKDHRVLHVTHPYIMKNKIVISETIHFLSNGCFSKSTTNRLK